MAHISARCSDKTVAMCAIEYGKSLNATVEEAIEHMVGER